MLSPNLPLKAEETIKKYKMLGKNDAVIAALSGGADSVALLFVLIALKEKYNLKIYAAHLNHGIRGSEAERDENFCRSLCKRLGVEIFVKKCDVPHIAESLKIGEELCGRNLRYEFFEELSHTLNAKIATAHTASDNAETLIFNLASGAGLAGMSGIAPVRGSIIRPLIEATRDEIEVCCAANGLEYVTDSTNLSDDYTRNYIRRHIVPELKRLNPSFEHTAAGDCETAREALEFLNRTAAAELERCAVRFGYDCKKLASLAPAVLKQAIIILIKNNCGISPSRKTVNLICDIIKSDKGGCVELSKQRTAAARQGIFRFIKTDEVADCSKEISLKENMAFSMCGKSYAVSPCGGENDAKNSVNSELACKNAVFRTRRSGDRFTYAAGKVTKPLRKVMNEMKIPSEMRDKLVLLAIGGTVIWCEEIGVSLEGTARGENGLLISKKSTPHCGE